MIKCTILLAFSFTGFSLHKGSVPQVTKAGQRPGKTLRCLNNTEINSLLPALVILVQYMVGCTTELQLINPLLTILTNYLLGVCTQL